MAAVRAAAADLLAERGPRDISVRDVAERAGVNHALVHRHFGTKDDLFRAVIAEQSAAVGALVNPPGALDIVDVLRQLQSRPTYWRILARAVLDAPQLLEPGRTSAASTVLAMLSGSDERVEPDATTRTAAAVAGSLALGWIVFGDHLAAVLDISDDDGAQAAVADAIRLALSRRAS
jgi:AcrR family transcriptional regulator